MPRSPRILSHRSPIITATPDVLELRAGDLRLRLCPPLGGCLAGLWHGDLPVLQGTDPAAGSPASALGSACFVMAPYAHRLALHRFRWLGQDVVLPAQPDVAGPHALDGMVRQQAWSLVASGPDVAELRMAHRADEHWPFGFELSQRVELSPQALTLRLVFTNTDAVHHQPVGLGWQPRFARRSRSRLHIELSDRWENDATGLPTRRQAQSGIDADVAHLDYDHCFEGWRGTAKIRDEKLHLGLTSSLPYLVVSTPPTEASFCVAPVSQVSNAIHMADPLAHGLRKLAPGESTEAWMTLSVARL